METYISITGLIIAGAAFYLTYLVHRSVIITNIENQLTIKAQECNKYIIAQTQGPPDTFASISAVLTQIIYAKRLLNLFHKNHGFLLSNHSPEDFKRFLYFQLHSSNIELIKIDISLHPDTTYLHVLQAQKDECFEFFKEIILENPSHPKSIK